MNVILIQILVSVVVLVIGYLIISRESRIRRQPRERLPQALRATLENLDAQRWDQAAHRDACRSAKHLNGWDPQERLR